MKTIKFSDFKEEMRIKVTVAMDEFVKKALDNPYILGWNDGELPSLFKSVDAHAESVAKRLNSCGLDVKIDMES